jgi:hypothetical protein
MAALSPARVTDNDVRMGNLQEPLTPNDSTSGDGSDEDILGTPQGAPAPTVRLSTVDV